MSAEREIALLERAAQALRGHGLSVTMESETTLGGGRNTAGTWLSVSKDNSRIDYSARVARRLTPGTVGSVLARHDHPLDVGCPLPLLITDHVTSPLADRLRANDQQFVDAAGNAYLEGRGVFIYVTGRKLREKQIALRASQSFASSRLKVLFRLICDGELAGAPYPTIAAAADVALGTMRAVVADLQEHGWLQVNGKQRRLNRSRRLLDDWADAYARELRGKTLIGRYSTASFDSWRDWALNPAHLRWSGEPAAALLGCDIDPGVLTLYSDKLPARLIAHEHLAPAGPLAYEKLIELRKPFWGESLNLWGRLDCVPPALVYADLLATGNARCIEAAQIVYDYWLARTFPVR